MWVLDKAIVIEHWTSLSFCSVVLYDLISKQRYSSHFYPQNTKSTLDVQIELYPYGKKKMKQAMEKAENFLKPFTN